MTNSDLRCGDRVVVRKNQVRGEIYNMLEDKVGTVVIIPGSVYWDVIAQFNGTARPGGYFGFMTEQIEKVNA